jgi:PUA domain protein
MTPGSKSKVKSSVQRAIRAKVLESYPLLEPHIDEILPKKEQLELLKLYVLPNIPSPALLLPIST